MPDYDLSLIPPVVGGSHLLQLEGLEPQAGNLPIPSTTSSTSSVNQPRGIAQSSIAVPPQLFPFIRQPYPPNYIPYNPYFSQLYLPPQNANQLLSHGGFPHQPSAGNIYAPPTAAGPGIKYPIPPVYRPGNIAGNLTHFGISSSYGSYGASGPGYGSPAALPPGTSNNDDIAGSELKEKNMYSTIKQNADLHVLSCASGRDTSPLLYNPPHVGFSQNSFPSIYHPSQSMSSPSPVQQSQREFMVPSYPQPQQTPLLNTNTDR